jgi:phytoene dehydrogenase-like protein
VSYSARQESVIRRIIDTADCVLARSILTPADIEAHNSNLVGGDIAAGVTDLRQFFTRPTWRNYSTPAKRLYICSASTPPGVGVHGMCGYYAAKRALKVIFGISWPQKSRDSG